VNVKELRKLAAELRLVAQAARRRESLRKQAGFELDPARVRDFLRFYAPLSCY
jgi:hypothetical protein